MRVGSGEFVPWQRRGGRGGFGGAPDDAAARLRERRRAGAAGIPVAQQGKQPVSEHMRLPFPHQPPAHRVNRICLRVWRFVAGGPQWLYTYSGAVDHAVVGNVMQTIRRLTQAVPGEWIVDVLIIGVEHGLLRTIQADLQAMRPQGIEPRLRHLRRRRAWLARQAATSAAPPLLH
jgi:hypothetical protein